MLSGPTVGDDLVFASEELVVHAHLEDNRQVRTFRDLFLITELLDSKAESDDVGFEAELARMSCQIERAFRFVEVLKKAAADPSNRSSIDPPLFPLSRSGSNSCCQSSLSIVS